MVMILICIYYSQFSNNWQALKKYNSMDTRKRRFMYIALGGRRELEKTGGVVFSGGATAYETDFLAVRIKDAYCVVFLKVR